MVLFPLTIPHTMTIHQLAIQSLKMCIFSLAKLGELISGGCGKPDHLVFLTLHRLISGILKTLDHLKGILFVYL